MKFWLLSFLACSNVIAQTNGAVTNSGPAYVEKNPVRLAMAAHPDYAICIRDLNQSMATSFEITKKIKAINSEDALRRSLKLPPNGRSSMIPIFQSQIKNVSEHIASLRRQEYSMDQAYGIPKAEFSIDGRLLDKRL